MRRIKLLVVLGGIIAIFAAPWVVFSARAPVLVVTEAPFVTLYGEARLLQERKMAARALFRRVKPVLVADGVSPDMVVFAITEASKRPKCVLFARSQAPAAGRYHEQFPEITVVVLSGLTSTPELPPPDGFLCIYGTDRLADLYRAGLFAGILGVAGRKIVPQTENQDEKPAEKQPEPAKTYILWQDRTIQQEGREHFSRGVQESDPDSNAIFINVAAQLPDVRGIACLTLTGAGAEYLERNTPVPLILFSWLDPIMVPQKVVVQFDDSVWALAVPAARMALRRQAEGKIPSKPLIFSRKTSDNSIFRLLQKSAKKVP